MNVLVSDLSDLEVTLLDTTMAIYVLATPFIAYLIQLLIAVASLPDLP